MIHFSIQRDHVHLIVEADDESSFKAGVHSLAIRLALAINQSFGRKGRAIGDRYHARALSDPTQVRASMVYVLLNFRKHLRGAGRRPVLVRGILFRLEGR